MKDHRVIIGDITMPRSVFIRRLLAIVLGTSLFFIGLSTSFLWQSRLRYEKNAEVATQNLSHVLAAQMDNAVGRIDLTVQTLVDEVERQLAEGGIDSFRLNSSIDRHRARSPFIDGLRVVNAEGENAYGIGVTPGLRTSVADRAYFSRLRSDPKAGLVISEPLVGRVSKKWSIVLARRVNGPEGRFAGLVYGTLTLEHLLVTFSNLEVGKQGSITLRNNEMALMARYPPPEKFDDVLGKKNASRELQLAVAAKPGEGSYRTDGSFDRVARSYSYHKVSDRPLYVIVGLAYEEYLAPWWDEARRVSFLVLLFVVGAVVSSWFVYRGWLRRTSAAEALALESVALRESEERFRTLIDHAGDGVEVLDFEGGYTDFNLATLRQLGYTREELCRLTVFDTDPLLSRRAYSELTQSLSQESSQALEAVRRRKDGTMFPVGIVASLVQLHGVRHMLRVVRDSSERKRSEEQIRKLSRAVEQSPASIIITDLVGAIEYVNPAFTQITGYTLEEVQGKNPRLFKGNKTTDQEYRALWHAVTRGREWRGELHNRKKNGEYYWEHASIAPIVNDAGSITHFLAVKEDITKRRVLEDQLRQAQKLESIGQLAGGVAHDFNNILSSTMMHLSWLAENPSLTQETRESLNDLIAQTKRGANLTRQLLMFGRRSILKVSMLDLNGVVEHFLKMLRRLLGEHIQLEFNPGTDLPLVEADEGMMEQVVMNLCVNARDAMPKGGILTISLQGVHVDEPHTQTCPEARVGYFACLSVKDTGCGMDEETLKHIFEPFYTTKEAGQGTGLGLATVHGIIGQHKGWIEVESDVGQGTSFRVYLPASSRRNAEPSHAQDDEAMRGHETILVVEDELGVRYAVSRSLRMLGYSVLEAGSGAEALRVWEKHQQSIDLLLTDMIMPGGMSGLDLTLQLRGAKPDLKVIIHSGYSADLLAPGIEEKAHLVCVPKPCPLETLSKAIRDCLDHP
jgi:PAS domain S-box-containing protein